MPSKKVRAMVLVDRERIEPSDFPYPQVEDDAMVAKVRIAGICGSDHHMWSRPMENSLPLPMILGHEVVGEVDEIGRIASGRMEVHGEELVRGDRITWCPVVPCGKCWSCRWLANNLRGVNCEKADFYGWGMSCKDPPHLFGAFAEYTYLKPNVWVYRLPDDLPDKVALLLDTLASVNGIDRAMSGLPSAREGFMWGQTAVVQGAGSIGIMAALKFKEYGASEVIMVGGPDHRLRIAKKFGIDHTISIDVVTKAEERIEEVKKLTGGRGADIVFEGAGVPAAFPEGIEMVRNAGIYVETGCGYNVGTVEIDPSRLNNKDLTIICQNAYSPQQYDRDLPMLYKWYKEGRYPLEDIVTNEIKLTDLEEGIRAHKAWKTLKVAVAP